MHLRAQQVQVVVYRVCRLKTVNAASSISRAKLSVLRASQINQAQNSNKTSQ